MQGVVAPKPEKHDSAVVMHSNGSGYVVRTVYENDWMPQPYTGATIIKRFSSEKLAQKHADRLNATRSNPPRKPSSSYVNPLKVVKPEDARLSAWIGPYFPIHASIAEELVEAGLIPPEPGNANDGALGAGWVRANVGGDAIRGSHCLHDTSHARCRYGWQ